MQYFRLSDINVLALERFNAIYGKSLDIKSLVTERAYKQLQYAESHGHRLHHYELTRGAVGCFLSHATLYNRLLTDDKDFYIIFEDDAKIPRNVVDKVKYYIDNAPADWDFLLFGTIRQVVTHQNHLYYKVKSWWGLCGYVISKSGAEKFLKEFNSQKRLVDMQIDSMLSMMAVEDKINVYSTRNALIKADGGVTDIQLPVKYFKNIDPFAYNGVSL